MIQNFKNECLEKALNNWGRPTITSLELKEFLIKNHNEFYWTQSECSRFLSDSKLRFTDNGTYKTYFLTTNGFYFRRSNSTFIPINTMSKKHVENALVKYYSNITISYLLQHDSEAKSLLTYYLNENSN